MRFDNVMFLHAARTGNETRVDEPGFFEICERRKNEKIPERIPCNLHTLQEFGRNILTGGLANCWSTSRNLWSALSFFTFEDDVFLELLQEMSNFCDSKSKLGDMGHILFRAATAGTLAVLNGAPWLCGIEWGARTAEQLQDEMQCDEPCPPRGYGDASENLTAFSTGKS